MLSLTSGYARLEIPRDQPFTDAAESLRMVFQVCRLNGLSGALVVSRQAPTDWRSCMRVAMRFSATRSAMPRSRFALVVQDAGDDLRKDVIAVAKEVELECSIFDDEANAIEWLAPTSDVPVPRTANPAS